MFLQRINQSYQEKVDMYMKLDKEKLVEMLIQCNNLLETQLPSITTNNICSCHLARVYEINGKFICTICNKPLI
jgi:hypothetical protein